MPDLRPSPLNAVRKTGTRIRARGIGEVLSLAAGRVRAAVGSDDLLIFYLKDLVPEAAPPPPPPGVTVRPATADDARTYARDIGTDSAATFAARLSDATNCWLVLEGDRILHASWTTTAAAWVRELRRYFRPSPGELYIYESFTRADGRGRGAYPLALGTLTAAVAAAGLTRAWVGVEVDNLPSIKAITKGGFRPGCSVAYRRRAGRLHVELPLGADAGSCAACLALGGQG